MSRPASDNQHVQYVGLDERENSQSVYSYVPAPSYDTSSYVYPVTNSINTDLSVISESDIEQPAQALAASTPAAAAAAAQQCKRKLCMPACMVRVALVLFIVALVQPYWFHSSATFVVAPSSTDDQSTVPDTPTNPPMLPTPPSSDDSDETDEMMPPPPPMTPVSPADLVNREQRGHVTVLSDNSTIVNMEVHQGLWRACVNGDCQKMGCCKRNRAASMLCGKSKAIACMLIAGCVLTLFALLATCCDRRGKFAGTRKVWIAPVLLFLVMVLGIVALVLASSTRHQVGRAPVHRLIPQSTGFRMQSEAEPHGDHHGRHHHRHHHDDDDQSDNGDQPSPPAIDPVGNTDPVADQSDSAITMVARSVQFGSSFYLVIMGLMSLFYGWLALFSHAVHQRCLQNGTRRCCRR